MVSALTKIYLKVKTAAGKKSTKLKRMNKTAINDFTRAFGNSMLGAAVSLFCPLNSNCFFIVKFFQENLQLLSVIPLDRYQ